MDEARARETLAAAMEAEPDAYPPGYPEMLRSGEYATSGMTVEPATAIAAMLAFAQPPSPTEGEVATVLNDIGVMMSEFVDNWPEPKKISTALALIAKTMRAALNPPQHRFWGAGEPDCPAEIKAPNGELHSLRCKVCGADNPRDDRCFNGTVAAAPATPAPVEQGDTPRRQALRQMVALDEDLEATHPGFMTGSAPMSLIEAVAIRGRLTDECEQAERRGDKRTTAEVRDIRALLAALSPKPESGVSDEQ